LFTPDVTWVADWLRWNSETEKRWKFHEELKQMYIDRWFGDKIMEIHGNYEERLETAIWLIDKMLQ
jgi:nicotinamide riboside kinase